TAGARDIAQTRDPGATLPQSAADDEVAELGRTLQDMLDGLEASRNETQEALQRQRQFVADASHELRTPLTSILANLELLVEVLDGERREAAHSALRSSQRMRRLVGDLLLLARADANRTQPHSPTDLGQVLVDAAAELGPLADDHHLTVDAQPAVVDGARDELHRMALNLMENAVRHTPRGSRVHATARASRPTCGPTCSSASCAATATAAARRASACRSSGRSPNRTAAGSTSTTPARAPASSCTCRSRRRPTRGPSPSCPCGSPTDPRAAGPSPRASDGDQPALRLGREQSERLVQADPPVALDRAP